ncbi:MAG: MOSC domain-containing protein, partial [Bacteroidota bacterium]
ENDTFTLQYRDEQRSIPKELKADNYANIQIWGDTCKGIILEDEVHSWLSKILGFEVRLAYQANEDQRKVDPDFAKNGEITSLSDGYPYLALGQASLDMLNEKLSDPIGINRFRANLVFSGGQPHEEDNWSSFKIGDASFYGAKPCSRCQVITINQETAEIGKEPTRTLARYRNFNHKIKFGMNVLCSTEGRIKVGDEIILS